MELRCLAFKAALTHIADAGEAPSPDDFLKLPPRTTVGLLKGLHASRALTLPFLSALAQCPPPPNSSAFGLDLSHYASVVMDHWVPPLSALPLSHLSLSNCSRLTEEALFLLLDQPAAPGFSPHGSHELYASVRGTGLSPLAYSLKAIDLSNAPGAITPESMEALASFPNLAEINLDNNTASITNVIVATLASGARPTDPQGKHPLRKLSMAQCEKVSGAGLAALAESASELESLDLSCATKITGQAIAPLVELRQMRYLKLRRCTRLTNEALAYIGQGMPELVVLDLYGCGKITDEGVLCLVNNQKLEYLCLSGTSITGSAFGADVTGRTLCEAWGALATLHMTQCKRMTSEGLIFMMRSFANGNKALRTLKLRSLSCVTASVLALLPAAAPSLERLDLSDCRGVQDDGMRVLEIAARTVGFGQDLVNLNLSGTLISDIGLVPVLAILPKLEKLSVAECSGLGDGTLLALTASDAKLTSLDLTGCPMLFGQTPEVLAVKSDSLLSLTLDEITSPAPIPSLVADLDHLEEVSMRGIECTESVLGAIAALPRLKSLSLRFMTPAGGPEDTNWSFKPLIKAKSLRELDVFNCEAVCDAACIEVFRNLEALESLNLAQCERLTDVGVRAVLTSLTELRSLNIRGCNGISPEVISELLFDLADEAPGGGFRAHALVINSHGLQMESLQPRRSSSGAFESLRGSSAGSSSLSGLSTSLGGGLRDAVYSPFTHEAAHSLSEISSLEERLGVSPNGPSSGSPGGAGRRRRRRRGERRASYREPPTSFDRSPV